MTIWLLLTLYFLCSSSSWLQIQYIRMSMHTQHVWFSSCTHSWSGSTISSSSSRCGTSGVIFSRKNSSTNSSSFLAELSQESPRTSKTRQMNRVWVRRRSYSKTSQTPRLPSVRWTGSPPDSCQDCMLYKKLSNRRSFQQSIGEILWDLLHNSHRAVISRCRKAVAGSNQSAVVPWMLCQGPLNSIDF